MVLIKWHNAEKSHIGKSNCGKYLVEIINNGSHFDYTITETKSQQVTHKNLHPHSTIEDAKKVISSLLSLRYMFV